MKSVLVVGAGPSGLVAAKTLIQHGNFKVTVFEAADRVGGMWRARSNEFGDKCSPHMMTNLSRFTVAFPDLAWTSVDLSDPVTGASSPTQPPMFPKAWQVGRYLQEYSNKYIPAESIKLNQRVTKVDFAGNSASWNVVSYNSATKQESSESFDYLVVGSGFFDKPARDYNGSSETKQNQSIRHSSKFRDVVALTDKSGKIVVFGGGISGAEAAATAAFQISNAKYAPGKPKPHADSKIYHIINRPFYCLPRYIPSDPYNPAIQDFNLAPKFLPVDLGLYNLTRRGDGQISAGLGTAPADKAKKGHEFLRSLVGGDQRDIGCGALVSKPEMTQYPGYTSLTDAYSEFVRTGLIIPVQGRMTNVESSPDSAVHKVHVAGEAPWSQPGNITTIENVAGIIDATGYYVGLDYLSDRVKEALSYDPTCPRVPFLLSRGSIFAPKVPNLAFVGFYEGPYWGVMEMQARLIANRWDQQSNGKTISSSDLDSEVAESVRKALREDPLAVPPFWMADYLGIIDEFARKAGMNRDDSLFNGQNGPTFPSRYQDAQPHEQAREVLQEVSNILQQSINSARFVAAAVFRAMQGTWTLQRKIDSRHTSMPGGTLKGTAHFHPRTPTDPLYASEYLYIESGTFTMDNGFSFPATRRYIYRYNETADTITAWFADEDGETAAALFNTWEFFPPSDVEHGWMAKGHHWCSPDTYRSSCEFRFRGAGLKMFGITYEVEGPKKDYSHESWYERPAFDG